MEAGMAQSVLWLVYVDGQWLESRQGKEMFLFFKTSRPVVMSSQPPAELVPGLFPVSQTAGK